MDLSKCNFGETKRRRYDDAFKREVVKQLIKSGKSISAVSLSLGIDRTNLQKWKLKYGDEFEPPKNKCGKRKDSNDLASLKKDVETMKETINQLRNIVKKLLECKYIGDEKQANKYCHGLFESIDQREE
jgi:transposase-like protein